MTDASEIPPRLLPVGDAALCVEFAAEYTPEAAAQARYLDRQIAALIAAGEGAGIVECVPTLRSLLIHFDPLRLSLYRLRGMLARLPPVAEEMARGDAWRLPICYEAEFAPDLADLSARLGLAPEEVVGLHVGGTYRSAMVGGYPGYAYLDGLSPRLAVPRRTTPRLAVPMGSLGIANAFTAIYPATVPGGWHIIGRTPVPLFDPARSARPSLIATGDVVTFEPVDAARFAVLAEAFQAARLDPIAFCRA